MKAIGNNLSNASSILTCLYRNARKHGGRYRCGMHDVLLTEGALLTVTQTTMTIMMQTIAMMAMTTADTIERAIAMTHGKENGTNLSPVTATFSPYARATAAIYSSQLCRIQSKTMVQ